MFTDLLARDEIRLLLLIMSPFVLIGTLMLLAAFIGSVRAGNKIRSWQRTTGRVLRADIMDDGDNGYYPKVTYEYIVNGQRYQADRMTLGLVMSEGKAETVAQQLQAYPPGQRIDVYYNPANPAKAVLELQARSYRGLFLSALLVFVLVGIVSAVWIALADPNLFSGPQQIIIGGDE